jgi:hypothetical protein
VLFRYPDGEADPFSAVKSLVGRVRIRAAADALRNSDRLFMGFLALATRRVLYKPGARANLAVMVEQEPALESTISLGEGSDRFGQPLARLDWRITDRSWRTIVRFSGELKAEVERLQLGRVRLHDFVREDEPAWLSRVADVNHHMGGARMSDTPEGGVVGTDLQVWGMPNCHVCSCSVFPTSSHSNPTLTLLALTARLADRIAPRRG